MIWKQNNSLFSFPSISWVVAFWTFSRRLALFCCCVAANWNHCSLRVHKVACFYGWRRWVSRGIRPSIQSSYGSILGAGGERGDIYLGLANRGHHHRHLPFLLGKLVFSFFFIIATAALSSLPATISIFLQFLHCLSSLPFLRLILLFITIINFLNPRTDRLSNLVSARFQWMIQGRKWPITLFFPKSNIEQILSESHLSSSVHSSSIPFSLLYICNRGQCMRKYFKKNFEHKICLRK